MIEETDINTEQRLKEIRERIIPRINERLDTYMSLSPGKIKSLERERIILQSTIHFIC